MQQSTIRNPHQGYSRHKEGPLGAVIESSPSLAYVPQTSPREGLDLGSLEGLTQDLFFYPRGVKPGLASKLLLLGAQVLSFPPGAEGSVQLISPLPQKTGSACGP